MRRGFGLILGLLAMAGMAEAKPVKYVLQPEASIVGFETDFRGDHINGQMPVTRADLTLDFNAVSQSKIAVTLDASRASASFPFAADAMKAESVLDTGNHPLITFQSTSVSGGLEGAVVKGRVTIRGVTRPLVLQAQVFRQKGTAADDLSHLTVRLWGSVSRSDFGAIGFADMVADQVRLDIRARIAQVK